jgi:hypothetical protein
MGGGPKGMAVIWASESRDEVMHCLTVINPKLAWQDLPLLAKLGVHKTQYARPNPKDKHSLPNIVDTRNITLEIFTTDYNPASPTFGIPGHTARGQIVLRRSDQQSAFTITKSIIEPMELFLQDRLPLSKLRSPIKRLQTCSMQSSIPRRTSSSSRPTARNRPSSTKVLVGRRRNVRSSWRLWRARDAALMRVALRTGRVPI